MARSRLSAAAALLAATPAALNSVQAAAARTPLPREPETSKDRVRTRCSHRTSLQPSGIDQRNSGISPGGSNLEDVGGNGLFEDGFLGLDNNGPIERSHLPVGGILAQSGATGWMAFMRSP